MEKVSTKAAVALAGALGVAFVVACWRLREVSKEMVILRDKVQTAESLRAEVTALRSEVQHYRTRQMVGEVLGEPAAKAPIQGDHTPPASGIIARFERAEGDLDGLFAAAKDAGSLDRAAREEVIRWLKESLSKGDVPAMYLIARMQASAGEMDDAVQWMLTGNVMAAVDADRYADKPVLVAALRPIQQRLEDVSSHARDRKEMQRACIRTALETEEQCKARAPAQWLEARAVSASPAVALGEAPAKLAVLPVDAWQVRRQATRDAFSRWAGR